METNTGRYYMLSALKRQYTDRVPTTVLIGPFCSNLTRYTVRDILTDAKKSAEAHLAFYNRFKPDSIVVYNDMYMEVEALGCKLDFPEDRISHPKSILLEDKSQLAKLKLPDPNKDGRIPYWIELGERVSSQVRKTTAVGLGNSGPWNIAMHLRGVEPLLMDTDDDPEFVHQLMRFTTEVVRTLGDAIIEAGFSPSIGEACASCSLISPKIYQTFIKPYHRELCHYFKSKGALLALHICGLIDPIMQDIMDTGIRLLSLDAPSSLKKLVDLAAGKLIIMGNVPTVLFSTGPRQEMEQAIRDCIETAAEGSGYILSSGCEIPINSTEEMIDHFFTFGHQYGQAYMSKLKDRRPNLFQK
jgi:uroporphyrinogen decarboxylase